MNEVIPVLLRQMKYFMAVAKLGSFTEAAEECYISQSAISQQIQALEKDLGIELIHRENRRFTLTPAGEYFYRHSRELLDDIENLRRETIRIGQDNETQLRIGYLSCYSGQELHQTISDFSQVYPEVSIHIVNGTHEELYDLIRFGGVDLVLNDQRRAFSDEYENFQLLECDCYVEVCTRNKLSSLERVTLEDLKRTACILISSKEQQGIEQEYYQNTLGFSGNFLFAENLEEGRLMVVGNRGFMPLESVGTLTPPGSAICRIPLYRNEHQVRRNYCAFWKKERTNYYIEEFADILRNLLRLEENK